MNFEADPTHDSQSWVLAKPNVGVWQTPKPRAGIGFSLQNPKSLEPNFGLLAVPKLGSKVGDLPKPKNFMQIPAPQIPAWHSRSPRLPTRPPTRAARATPAASGGGMYGRSHVGPRRALVSPNSPVQGELRYGGEHTRVGGGGGLRYTLHAVTHHTPNARTQNHQRVDASIHVS